MDEDSIEKSKPKSKSELTSTGYRAWQSTFKKYEHVFTFIYKATYFGLLKDSPETAFDKIGVIVIKRNKTSIFVAKVSPVQGSSSSRCIERHFGSKK